MSRAVNNELVKGATVGSVGALFPHLLFADDIVFFLEPNVDSFVNILSILRFFEVIYGLKINLAKNSLAVAGVNVRSQISTTLLL